MKKYFYAILMFSAFFAFSCSSSKQARAEEQTPVDQVIPELTKILQIDDNKYSCSFDDIVHDFIIDLPQVIENAPLVIMLPGYNNTAEAMRSNFTFEKEACQKGYAVVYVTGSVQQGDKIRTGIGWNSGISSQGNKDLQFIVALTEYLQQKYSFDSSRTFAIGFSNGGFMVHRLAMEAGDVFDACVSVGAKMPAKIWDERNEKNHIGYFQITGSKDEVVPKNSDGSARYTKDPAIEDVMDYWASSNGLTKQIQEEIGDGSILFKWQSADEDKKSVQVWHLLVKDGHHSWPSMLYNKIDTNSLILDFLDYWNY